MNAKSEVQGSGSQVLREWTIWNSAGNYPLISVGGREANQERLDLLERDGGTPGQFYLVYREIGPWTKDEEA